MPTPMPWRVETTALSDGLLRGISERRLILLLLLHELFHVDPRTLSYRRVEFCREPLHLFHL
jgi:hypothetical protein